MNKNENLHVTLLICNQPDRNGVVFPEGLIKEALSKGPGIIRGEVLFEDETELREWNQLVEERVGIEVSDFSIRQQQVTGRVRFAGPRAEAAQKLVESGHGEYALRALVIKDHNENVTEIRQLLSFDLIDKER